MPSEKKVWTVLDIIKWGTGYLVEKGFDEARLNIELLLSATLGLKRFDLYVRYDQPLKQDELERFKVLLRRRLAHEPVQYIIGKTNFYSIDLKVDRRALIPRPETEVLVESVIEHCKNFFLKKEPLYILEIGTGSGCIPIAIAKFLKNACITSLDKSREALDLARENAGLTGTGEQIDFCESDFLALGENIFGKKFDVIVSNPPYVSQAAFETLAPEIKEFEPAVAVSDGTDGLTFFRKISHLAPLLLNNPGWIFVETSFNQSQEIEKIFRESGCREIQIKKDLANVDRVVAANWFKK